MTDLPDWHETIARLGRRGIAFKVSNNGGHVKIRSVNYTPATGTIWIDGTRSFPQKGFTFLLTVLEAQGLYKRREGDAA